MVRHLFLALLLVLPTVSAAETITFRLRSFDTHSVEASFYSQNRNRVWPGGDQVYVLRDYETKHFPLTCVAGEKICFGAWVQGSSREYWGVGKDGKQGCTGCCYVCGDTDETPIHNLNE